MNIEVVCVGVGWSKRWDQRCWTWS